MSSVPLGTAASSDQHSLSPTGNAGHVPQQQEVLQQKPLRRRRANTPSKSWFGVGGGVGGVGSGSKRSSRKKGSTTLRWSNQNNNNNNNNTNTANTSTNCFNRCTFNNTSFEKLTIGVLLLVAWGWIIVTIGMVFYHGYHNPRRSSPMLRHDRYLPGLEPPSSQEDDTDEEPPPMINIRSNKNYHNSRKNKQQKHRHRHTTNLGHGTSPLLIFTFRRADYLQKTLQQILEYIPHDPDTKTDSDADDDDSRRRGSKNTGTTPNTSGCRSVGCPIIVSQDGTDAQVAQVIQNYTAHFQALGIPLVHLQHQQDNNIQLRGFLARITNAKAYAALAQHYKWALDKVFYEPIFQSGGGPQLAAGGATLETPSPQRVIILEEDLLIAPDFFDYFAAVAPLLDSDPTLLAASAYNDNGLENKVANATRLLRSDFFPGLGWMMTRRLWTEELSSNHDAATTRDENSQSNKNAIADNKPRHEWPVAFWDDWLREPLQRQGRHIIRPEVSRTLHFGSHGGTSNNQFGNSLEHIQLNQVAVSWNDQDLSYLQQPQFDADYWKLIQSAQTVQSLEQIPKQQDSNDNFQSTSGNNVFRLEYRNQKPEFERLARKLGLFTDEKAGIPRTAYKGVVETRLGANGPMVLLTPPMDQLKANFANVDSVVTN